MSRSYKHTPSCKAEKSCKWGKRQANKRVRKFKGDLGNGKLYKKLYCSWEICDYKFNETWEEYKDWHLHPRWWHEPEEPKYFDWYKSYKMK